MIATGSLRQKLLALAVSGKLVPQDPNEEPAWVLVERLGGPPLFEGLQPIPAGWTWTTLGSITVNRDAERVPLASAVRKQQKNRVYDYYGAAGVIDKVDSYLFSEKLLLIGEDGANLLSRSKPNAFFAEGKYWVNNHAHILDAKERSILDYVALYINSIKLDEYVTGTAQPKLNQENLKKIPIPLPPLEEQKRIVARLEELLSLEREIAADGTALDDLVAAARRKILDLAVSGKLVPRQGEWRTVKLGDVCSVARGGSPRPIKDYLTEDADGLNWIKIGDADGSRYITSVREKIRPEGVRKTRLVYSGDLLLTNSMSFGHPYILKVDGCIHDGWLVLHPFESIDKEYLYHVLSAPDTMQQFRFAASGGVVSNLNSDKVVATTIPLPPLAEQKAIVKRVDELMALLDAMKG